MQKIQFEKGTEQNFSGKSAVGEFTLHGDPKTKPEKPLTVVKFPGGMVEISRTTDNQYWAHITVHRPETLKAQTGSASGAGRVVDARIDARGRYLSDGINREIMATDFEHIAILIDPD